MPLRHHARAGVAQERLVRNAPSRFWIVDAQSVKNTDTAALKGYDSGKKVSGIKRHIAVTTAERKDRKGALLCDSGYGGQAVRSGRPRHFGAHVSVQIAKRSELHTFQVMPQRWVVERCFAWLQKNRRLWKNCQRLLNTRLQLIHLAFLAVLLKRL